MKNLKSSLIAAFWLKVSVFIVIFLSTTLSSKSQKLPNKQDKSLWAPDGIQVDGRSTEWKNRFQAYNTSTGLFYAIANDSENLYVVFQAFEADVLTKIISKGICLQIVSSKMKNEKDAKIIIYPYFDNNDRPYLSFKNLPKIKPGLETSFKIADSVMKSFNKRLGEKSKEIKVLGIPGIDTLISVFNDNGITARQAFDVDLKYTCELKVPLKYLGLSVDDPKKIVYHVVLPAMSYVDLGITVGVGADGIPTLTSADGAGAAIPSKSHLSAIYSTTDFWGDYALAKKP